MTAVTNTPLPARLGQYVHSDALTPIKGVAVAKIQTRTDFAARTEEVGAFARQVAKMAYAAQTTNWNTILEAFGDLERERASLAEIVREPIVVAEIVLISA